MRTDTDSFYADVALKYKQLWMVEDIFRTMKSILETRPIYHKGFKFEWADILRDVDSIEEVSVTHRDNNFIIRTEVKGVAGKVFQAASVCLPPALREGEKCGTTPMPNS